jgi:2-iminobutanoate/2-iminopropanoate deaminase
MWTPPPIPPTPIEPTPIETHKPSRRRVLQNAAGASLLLSGLPAGPAGADTRWLASEHPVFSVGATVGGLTFVAQDAGGPGGPGGVPADTVGQARRTLENLKLALTSSGQTLDNVVFLHVMLVDHNEAPAVAELVSGAFPNAQRAPTTCFIGVSGLGPGRRVRMDAIATTLGDRAHITVPGLARPFGTSVHAVRVGDLVFTGAVDAPDAPLDAAVPPSAVILDRTDEVMRAAGLGLKDSFRQWSFIRNLRDPAVQRAYGRGRSLRLDPILAADEYPATSRMGSPALGAGVAHRSYGIATRGARQYVESKFARRIPRLFAQSVRAGDWLFIAGQDSVDVANQTLFVGDLRRQTDQCIRQLEFIMQAAGGTLDDIVKTTVFLLEGTDRAVFLDAYGEQFRRRLKSPWMPAGLTMDLDAMRPDCLVEIDAVAWLGGR